MPHYRKEAAKGILSKPFDLFISITGKCKKKRLRKLVQILFKTKPSRNITKIEK